MSVWRHAVDFHTPALTAAQFAVLAAIAGNANDDGIAWPSMATIAVKAHCTDKNAQRTVKILEDAGYLKRFKRIRHDGSSASNLYQLSAVLLDCVEDCRCPVGNRARLEKRAEIRVVNPDALPKEVQKAIARIDPPPSMATPHEDPIEETEDIARTHAPARTPVLSNARNIASELIETSAPENVRPGPIVQAELIWRRAYLGDAPGGLLAKKLKPLFETVSPARVLRAWDTYCNNTGPQYVNIDKFVATWGSWEDGVPAKTGVSDALAAHRAVFGGSES